MAKGARTGIRKRQLDLKEFRNRKFKKSAQQACVVCRKVAAVHNDRCTEHQRATV